jgi:purine nucleosidase
MPQPVILDTDIGTDIDDAYALVLAAVSPELELRAVTTVNNDVLTRACIARKLLNLLGYTEVPVAKGERNALTPGMKRGWAGHEGRGIDLSDIDPQRDLDPRHAEALIADLAEEAHAAGQPLTLLTIGAMTNVAVALNRYPKQMAHVGKIIAMASTFHGFGEENAQSEHNVACDPVAVDRVLHSGIPITLVGLNVTQQTALSHQQVERFASLGGPLAEALVGMHRVWFEVIGRDQSAMHDPLAVAVAFCPDLVTLLPVKARVLRDSPHPGAIAYYPPDAESTASCHVATSVDVDAFHALFVERISGAMRCVNE